MYNIIPAGHLLAPQSVGALAGAVRLGLRLLPLHPLRALHGILAGTIAASMTLIACTTPQDKQGYALGIATLYHIGPLAFLLLTMVMVALDGRLSRRIEEINRLTTSPK